MRPRPMSPPSVPIVRRLLPAALMIAVLAACSSDEPGEPDGPAPTAAPDDAEPSCPSVAEVDPAALELTGSDAVAVSHALAAEAFSCAQTAVVVPADDPALAAVGAPLAASAQAPLLLDGDLGPILGAIGDPEVRDLGDEARTGVSEENGDPEGNPGEEAADGETTDAEDGDAADGGDDGTDTNEGANDLTDLALAIADELDAGTVVLAAADQPADLAAAASLAIRTEGAVVPVAGDLPDVDDREVVAVGQLADDQPDLADDEAPWPSLDDAEVVWAIDPAAPEAAATIATAAVRGDAVLAASGGDLLDMTTVGIVRDAGVDADRIVPVGTVGDDPQREVAVMVDAPLLPGGTLRHFDGTRMVALYGRPGAPVLGVLGEQELDETIERAREVGEGYDADGREVVPTLEVIVSVATQDPQDDESYSALSPASEFQDLVDLAGEEDVQVILDLQPGRTDFLTQAREYEELLREPHVGLALDPEWRLEDDQVHLEQIGGVEAAEVQEVVDWYAELTRDAGLSEGLLVLHQFRLDMLRDRDTVEVPPEIAAVVHADGQGPQEMKLETWRVMTAEGADQWRWGWKNFYDEDPVVATPDQVLDLDPEVVLVTYQ